MGKKSKVSVNGNTITINADNVSEALDAFIQKPIEITNASIKELLCNYGYEIKTGPCAGDKIPTRKGSAEVHDDMVDAFSDLNVHLAVIDDAFQYVFDELHSLDELKDHDVTGRFTVTGFKISGTQENEGYILMGEKYVSHGNIGLETPKITSGLSYPFFDKLKEGVEKARVEVEAYMNGKAAAKVEQGEFDFPEGQEDDNGFDNPIE